MTFWWIMLVCAGAGGFCAHAIRSALVIKALEDTVSEQARRLRESKTDVEIVRALRAGDLDPTELRALDLVPTQAEQKGTNELAATNTVVTVALEPKRARFIPNIYKRNPLAKHLTPGDEVWVSQFDIQVDALGRPMLLADSATAPHLEVRAVVRLRVYEDGTLEMGMRKGTAIGSGAVSGGVPLRIHRVIDLESHEIREIDWHPDWHPGA